MNVSWTSSAGSRALTVFGLALVFNGGSAIAAGRLSDLGTFQPVAANVSLETSFAVAVPNVLTHQWTGTEPAGNYVFFLLVVKAGALADGAITMDDVVGLSLAPFTFTP